MTAPQCESHSVELFFGQLLDKVCNLVVCFSMLLIQKKLSFFGLDGIEFVNFDPPINLFPMMFNMFVNIIWRPVGFDCMWVVFEFGSFNKLYCI